MLLSARVGVTGLTVAGATRMILCEPFWSPGDDTQVKGRCHRLGQTKPVYISSVIGENSVIDALMSKSLASKRTFNAAVSLGITRQDGEPYIPLHLPDPAKPLHEVLEDDV